MEKKKKDKIEESKNKPSLLSSSLTLSGIENLAFYFFLVLILLYYYFKSIFAKTFFSIRSEISNNR